MALCHGKGRPSQPDFCFVSMGEEGGGRVDSVTEPLKCITRVLLKNDSF